MSDAFLLVAYLLVGVLVCRGMYKRRGRPDMPEFIYAATILGWPVMLFLVALYWLGCFVKGVIER